MAGRAGDRLGQVELAEPGSGDQQGGAGAGDQLWQEVGYGCTGCVSSFFHETFSVKIDSAKYQHLKYGGKLQITNPCRIHPLGFWTKQGD